MNKKKRILAVIITIAVIFGAVAGISFAVRTTTSGGKVMVVHAEELNYGYGYFEGESMEGYVTSDRVQNVTLNSSQSVAEVKVEEGQEVKKGDVLLLYDMKQTEVNLEKAELRLEMTKLSLKNAEDMLKKLRNTAPSSGDEEAGDEMDEGEEEDIDENIKKIKKPKAADSLTGKAKPYYEADSEYAPGTEENPYRFLVKAGATVNADFINMVKKLQGENPVCYFVLELRENDSWDGKLIRAWKQNASDVLSPDKDWVGIIDPDNEKPIIPTKTFAEIEELEKKSKDIKELEKKLKDKEDDLAKLKEELEEAKKNAAEENKEGQKSESENQQIDEQGDNPGAGDQDAGGDTDNQNSETNTNQTIAELEAVIQGLQKEKKELIKRIDELEKQSNGSESNDINSDDVENTSSNSASSADAVSLQNISHAVHDASYRTVNMPASTAVYRKITPVTETAAFVQGAGSGSSAVLTALEDLEADEDFDDLDDLDDDSDLEDDEKEDDSIEYSPDSTGGMDEDASYTREELTEAIKSQEETIADLKLDIREAELKVKKAKKALEDGSVKALLDGTVTKVGDLETARADGSAFIRVSGNSGVAIKGGLPEKFLGTINEGNQISIASWTDGMQYTATITEISPYPDTSGMFEGGGYNNSYYPFIAVIDDENAEMEDNDWVQISIDANTLAQDDGFYLMRAFVLEEGNNGYVYKRGEDGLLHRQSVKLGKLAGDSYEILSGLTSEDWVAFPYGKPVKEGAQTREGTMEELYNG